MKKIFIILLSVSIISCDDRLDFVGEVNEPPLVSINDFAATSDLARVEIEDLVKISVKTGSAEYKLRLYYSDFEGGLVSISYQFMKGQGQIEVNGDVLEGNTFPPHENGFSDITILPEGLGEAEIHFTVEDSFGKTTIAKVMLDVFDNLVPVAAMTIQKIAIIDPLEYDLDASESYDADEAAGGQILIYKYTINGVDLPLVNRPVIRYIFPKVGGYEIKLSVQDNDGAWSDEYVEIFAVN